MTVLPVNAKGREITAPKALRQAIEALPHGARVTIMVHGYRFCPFSETGNPHRHILSLSPDQTCWKAISWPRHLHLNRPNGGLGLAFGWPAKGRLAEVAARGFEAGDALADAIQIMRQTRPDLILQIIAHSLGARVALAALERLGPHDIHQIILLSGAEYRSIAERVVAGKSTGVLNVTSGENTLFDALFRGLVPAPRWRDWPLAAGLPQTARWVDLSIDRGADLAALNQLGFATRPPVTRICHWSGYLRPGLFKLYRGLFDPAQDGLFDDLARSLPARPVAAAKTRGQSAAGLRRLPSRI